MEVEVGVGRVQSRDRVGAGVGANAEEQQVAYFALLLALDGPQSA